MKLANSLIALGLILVTAGMIFVVMRGREHTPEQILNPTYFQTKAQIGHALARRFFVDVKGSDFVVFGVSKDIKDGAQIWLEFLHASRADGLTFEKIYSLQNAVSGVEGGVNVAELSQVEIQLGARTVLFVPSDEATWKAVSERFPTANTIFFQTPFRLLSADAENISNPCDRNSKALQFGCAARNASTRYYRTRLKEDRLAAVMDKVEGKLNLLFVSEPR